MKQKRGRHVRVAMSRLDFGTRLFLVFILLATTFTATSNFQKANAASAGSGACSQAVGSSAGVVVTSFGTDCVVKFTTTGSNTWTVPTGITSVRVLVVGGGGGGGAWVGGGGGGGGFRDVSAVSVTPQSSVAITVGTGGNPAIVSSRTYLAFGTKGGESKFGDLAAAGGGRGGSHPQTNTNGAVVDVMPSTGGSGGGGTGSNGSSDADWNSVRLGAAGNSPTTSPAQGNKGGDGSLATGSWVAAGGGGAGGAGSDATSTNGGAGGIGANSNISGSDIYYAGGGGGVVYNSTTGGGAGGSGGGGNGGVTGVDDAKGVSGIANTGGGGGGGTSTTSQTSQGGSGGSGVVIVRYSASIVPTFGTPTKTGDGFTVQITNYDANYTWSGSATASGTVSISNTGLVSVTGLTTNTSSTATITTTRTGYATNAASVISSSLPFVTNGSCNASVNIAAGVSVYDSGSRCYVAFKNTGTAYTWTPPSGVTAINLLVVGGGGGGGTRHGSGGGAGGLIESTNLAITTAQANISVGAGGAGGSAITGAANGVNGSAGSNSAVSGMGITSQTALGGGAGNGSGATSPSGTVGSGGGVWFGSTAIAGTAGQGNSGSVGTYNTGISTWTGGAGGGAGTAATTSGTTSFGGAGKAITWIPGTSAAFSALGVGELSGSNIYFAGGGGGGTTTPGYAGTGGLGGGKSGGVGMTAVAAPTNNTGGGGGGSGYSSNSPAGGAGGSGVVVISWTTAYTISYLAGDGGSGSAPTAPATVGIANSFIAPANTFIRAGYTFAGWSDGTNVYAAGATYPATGSVSGNVTLTATWTGNKYSYNSNTGSNPPSDQTYAGSTLTAASGASVSAPTGYTFNGWCTSQPSVGSACSGTRYVSGDNLPVPESSVVSLFAIWKLTSLETSGDTHVVSGTNGNTNYGAGTTLLLKNASNTTSNAFNRSVFLKFEYDPSIDWTGVALEVFVAANNSGGSTRWNTSYTTFNVNVYASNSSNWTENQITFNNANSSTDSWGINTATWPWSLDSNNLLGTISIPTSESTVGQKYALSNSDLANFLNNDPDGQVTLYLVRGDTDPGSNLAFHSRESATLAGPTISIPTSGYSYTIAYDINGGSGSLPAAGTFTNGGSAYMIANGTSITPPAGKAFSKWNSRADGSGTDYVAGASYSTSSSITLYAQWSNTTVTAIFKSNYSGGAADETQMITANTATNLTSNSFSRTGYTFAGWNTLANGTGTNYTNGQSVTLTTSLTLYAKWTASTNTVTFNSNFGTPTTTTQSIITDVSTALIANSFTRTGYTFAGWNTAANGSGADYSNNQSVTINDSLTLYAKWTANNNTVTFNSNYGTPTTSIQTIVSGTSTALTSNSFTRTGHTFAGWNTLADGSGTAFTNSQNVTIYAPFTLYAQWTEANYTVTYDKNGASGTPEKTSDVYGISTGALTLSTTGTMTRTGYTFDGWYTAASDGTRVGGASDSYTPTSNVTLYARWTAVSYSITFNSTGSTSGSAPSSLSYTTDGSAVTIPGAGVLVKTGYTFSKWNTRADGLGTDYAVGASLTTTAPVTLHPIWTANSYSITYSDQNKTSGTAPTDATVYNIGNTAYVKANTGLVRTGYTFAGWTTTQDNSGTVYQSGETYAFGAASVTFYPKWTENTYNITYNSNGATGTPARTSDTYTTGDPALTLPGRGTMTKTGYTFTGWSTSPTGIGQTSATTTSDVTLYAIWDLNRYTISFNRGMLENISLSGSQVATFPTNTEADYNTSITLGSSPTNVSANVTVNSNLYQFFGWSDGNTIYNPGQNYVVGAIAPTFTAQWIRLYEVRYALNGGSGIVDVDPECQHANNTCLANQSITLSDAPSRTGYEFAGWKDQANNSFNAGATTNVTNTSFVYYAQWTPINYSVTFDSIGGSNSPIAETKNIGQTVTLPSPGTRTGYDFSGWTLGGVTYGVGTTFTVGSSNAAFTALWTAKRFNVSYDWNGGVGTPTASSVYTFGNAAITLPTGNSHTKDGYVFNGWKDQDGNPIGSTHAPTQDTRFVAQWIDGSYTLTYNTVGGTLAQTTINVSRTVATTLPTPIRANFTFDGWYEDPGNTVLYGQAAASVTPAASKTLYAKWVQDSLVGINPAHLNSLTTITTQAGNASSWTGTHSLSGTGASLNIPADALPNGTVVQVSFVEDLTRPKNIINNTYAYYTSVVLHWQLGTGSSATVPVAAAGKPLVLTLTNPDIRTGAKIYKIIRGEAREVATATQDGQVTINVYEDPEIVVAATTPTAPRSVIAVGNLNAQSTISWTAPVSSGGATISGYTVAANPGGATCTTTGQTTCIVTGLSNDTSYNFTVTATNAVGTSVASATSNSAIPRLVPTFKAVFDTNGGSAVPDSLFTQPGTLAEPSTPTRTGYTFGGWLTQNGVLSSKVNFPYSPGVNSDLTLYAYWIANAPAVSTPSAGSAPSVSSPINTTTPITSTPSTNSPSTASGEKPPLINMPTGPILYSAPQTKFQELRDAPYPTNGLNVPLIGEFISLINREPVQTKISTVGVNTLIEIGQDLTLTLTSQTEQGESIAPSAGGAITVLKGGYIDAAGSGFKPGAPIEAWLYSEPIRLGDGFAAEEGTFDGEFAIDSSVPVGKHTVVLNGLTPTNEIVTIALGVKVIDKLVQVEPSAQPVAGESRNDDLASALSRVAGVAFIAVLFAILYLVIRRRKTSL